MSREGSDASKCVACDGIFRKVELSKDGRCPECLAKNKKPQRKRVPPTGKHQ